MNIQVYPHRIILNKTNEVNSGEYNVNECTFEFSQEYEGLTKVAVFSLCDGTTKNVTILNNQCIIPVECLQETGQVQIGVYGYATQDNELVLRYSPTPQNFVVRLGSYKEGTQPVAPTPTDWEILVEQVSDIAEDVSSIHEDITGINGEISGINIDIRDLQDTKANISDLAEVAFTGEFSDLKNIPSYATTQQLNQEIQDRQDADVNLQNQIDAISVSSDVVDVVGTYQELLDYDTTHLKDNDIVKVLQDSTHSDALSYYRWDKETSTWSYVGSEGPFYTKSETDALLNAKEDKITTTNKLDADLVDDTNSTNKFVTQADITNWNNKEDKSNKVTEINSSSTDTQYPSAKCVYDSQEEQNEQIAELEMLYNAFPTVSDEDTTIQLDNTAKVKFREIDLKGNTSQVVIPEEQGTSVSNTSIYVSDVNTDKEHTIEMSGNTYQKSSILPSEYTQVDYVESSGTQYIDTGINADINLDIEYEVMNTTSIVFGAIYDSGNQVYKRYHTGVNNDKYSFFILQSSSLYTIDNDHTVKHKFYIKANQREVIVDNTTYNLSATTSTDTELNFWLFRRNSNNSNLKSFSSFRLYSCKMYYNGTLVRDFIPCYRNSDNEVGLYDLVNNVFYTNQGTGAFTYGNVVSIPNPDYPQTILNVTGTNTIKINGKNLFNKSNANVLNAFLNNNSIIQASSSATTIYIPCKSSTTYTVQKSASGTNNRFCVFTTDTVPTVGNSGLNYVGTRQGADNNTSYTITTPSNAKYLCVFFSVDTTTPTVSEILNTIQIEIGSTATTYEAYKEKSYTINLGSIELCKIDTYKDKIYKSNDKWYLEKNVDKVILNGSESWFTQKNTSPYVFALNYDNYKRTQENICKCNLFLSVVNGGYGDLTDGQIRFRYNSGDNNKHLYICTTVASIINDFTTWLSTHNTTVYYVLATPTTTEITDNTLVNQLNALYNATIYPITNINTDTSNLLPYIDLHYNFVTPSPSPSRPSVVNVVKGNNTITISNSDNTESQVFPINLGDIELCKIGTYQDYIYESNGNWFKKENIGKTIINGTETTIIMDERPAGLTYYSCNIYNNNFVKPNSECYCDKLAYSVDSIYSNDIQGIKPTSNGRIKIKVFDSSLSTDSLYRDWLSENNLLVYYVLNTPTDTQITDTTLITQLNNIKKAYSYDTQTNISQTNADKPFIIYAEAIRSLKDVFE